MNRNCGNYIAATTTLKKPKEIKFQKMYYLKLNPNPALKAKILTNLFHPLF